MQPIKGAANLRCNRSKVQPIKCAFDRRFNLSMVRCFCFCVAMSFLTSIEITESSRGNKCLISQCQFTIYRKRLFQHYQLKTLKKAVFVFLFSLYIGPGICLSFDFISVSRFFLIYVILSLFFLYGHNKLYASLNVQIVILH